MRLRPVLVLPVLVLAVLGLCHCVDCPACDSAQAKAADAFNQAGYTVAKGVLGALAGPPPLAACSPEACAAARAGGPPTPAPWADDAAFHQPGACAKSDAADTPCVICVKASCCSETFSCIPDETCTCLLARKMGIAWPEESPCGDPDDAYTAEAACLDAHCAEECYP